MRKIISLVLSVLVASIFLGCGSKLIKVSPTITGGKDMEISKIDKDTYLFINWGDRTSHGNGPKSFENTMKVAAKFGRSKGYRYLAMRNFKMDNLAGYPLNTMESVKRYISLKDKAHFKPDTFLGNKQDSLIIDSNIRLRATFLKQKPKGLFVWDLNRI